MAPLIYTLQKTSYLFEPLHDAVDVEAVGAGAPHDRAVVARRLAIRAAAVEGDATDAAGVVVGDPPPEIRRHLLEGCSYEQPHSLASLVTRVLQ